MKAIIRLAAICILPLLLSFAPAEWKTFEAKGEGFKMDFPGQVTTSQQKIPSAIGELTMNIHTVQPPSKDYDENIVYMVIQTDYPAESISSDDTAMLPAFFRNAIDGGVANAKGKLVFEKEIKFNGYPGREIKIEMADSKSTTPVHLTSRIFLVKNRMYMMQVITRKEGNASIKKFWDSFALMQ
jgi:hypothetical protein